MISLILILVTVVSIIGLAALVLAETDK